MTETAADWNRECVVCGHKWLGSDRDECPRGPMCSTKTAKIEVPREPTQEMQRRGAAQMWEERGTVGYEGAARIFKAMISACQEQSHD
jgi:hypothetical protein